MSEEFDRRAGAVARPPRPGAGQVRAREPRRRAGSRHCTGTWALGYDRGMTPETPGRNWNEGLPDLDATYDLDDIRPGWEAGTQVVVADLDATTASPFASSPRAALRKAIADWRGARLRPYRRHGVRGVRLRARRGRWLAAPRHARAPSSTAPVPRSTRTGSSTRSGRRARRREIPLESVNSEYDTPQFEFTLRYARRADARPTRASCSRCWRARWRTASGLLMTFMGKPLSDRGGSGLHFNISLRDDDGRQRDQRRRGRRRGLGRWRKHAVGGHARAPPGARGTVRADRQRLQAAATGVAVGLLGELGLRPPRRDGAHPARARRAARDSSTD